MDPPVSYISSYHNIYERDNFGPTNTHDSLGIIMWTVYIDLCVYFHRLRSSPYLVEISSLTCFWLPTKPISCYKRRERDENERNAHTEKVPRCAVSYNSGCFSPLTTRHGVHASLLVTEMVGLFLHGLIVLSL